MNAEFLVRGDVEEEVVCPGGAQESSEEQLDGCPTGDEV
jgi:hypothetical protein